MFITRKQYELNLRRAKAEGRKEAEKEILISDRIGRLETNLYNAIDRVEERCMRETRRVHTSSATEGCTCKASDEAGC